MRIRPVKLADIDGLADSLSPDVSRAQVRRRYDESLLGYREMLVAELDRQVGRTVSTGGWGFQRPDSLRMFALDVGMAFRKRGVGTALIRAVESAAIALNLKEVNLEVSVDNVDAIRLYERLGYRRLPEPVTDCWYEIDDQGIVQAVEESSWIMVKEIGETERAAARSEAWVITNRDSADRVIRTLREHPATDDVEFFGSHRKGWSTAVILAAQGPV